MHQLHIPKLPAMRQDRLLLKWILKLYKSPWRAIKLILLCSIFVIGRVFMLTKTDNPKWVWYLNIGFSDLAIQLDYSTYSTEDSQSFFKLVWNKSGDCIFSRSTHIYEKNSSNHHLFIAHNRNLPKWIFGQNVYFWDCIRTRDIAFRRNMGSDKSRQRLLYRADRRPVALWTIWIKRWILIF